MCVLAVYNKAQRISNREFILWLFLQGTESRVATFLAETSVRSQQSLRVFLPSQESGQILPNYRAYCRCVFLPFIQCIPVSGKGFLPGAYRCVCVDGYYFPDTSLAPEDQYFDGSLLEGINFNGSLEEEGGAYRCRKCSTGCDVCVDDSPCLYSYSVPIRATLLTLAILMVTLIAFVSGIICLYRNQRVNTSIGRLESVRLVFVD